MIAAMSAFTEPAFAWQPITPRGVAAFARASFERLFVMQSVAALLGAATVVWLLSDGIYPTINAAIGKLPEAGQIHSGKLEWREDSPVLLAEGRILALSVDLEHGGALRSPADFQFEFGRDSVRSNRSVPRNNDPAFFRLLALFHLDSSLRDGCRDTQLSL